MHIRTSLTALLCLAFAAISFAEAPERKDPIEEHIFPPELVMQNQRALALSDAQKKTIRNEIRTAQSKFTDLQWELEDEMEIFATILGKEKIDEKAALDQFEKVMSAEANMKRTHLSLAIRIKNALTPEQQAKLQKLKHRDENEDEN